MYLANSFYFKRDYFRNFSESLQEGTSRVRTGNKDYDLSEGDNMLVKQGQELV